MNDDTRLDCSDMPEEKKMCGECHFFDEFACGWWHIPRKMNDTPYEGRDCWRPKGYLPRAEIKVCPMMSRPVAVSEQTSFGLITIASKIQIVKVNCLMVGCAMWIEEHCGLMANIVKIETAPKVEIGPVQREHLRRGIGSDPIVNKSKELV